MDCALFPETIIPWSTVIVKKNLPLVGSTLRMEWCVLSIEQTELQPCSLFKLEIFSSNEKCKQTSSSAVRVGSSKTGERYLGMCFIWETWLIQWPDVNAAWCIIQRTVLVKCQVKPQQHTGYISQSAVCVAHWAWGACIPRQRLLHHLWFPVNNARTHTRTHAHIHTHTQICHSCSIHTCTVTPVCTGCYLWQSWELMRANLSILGVGTGYQTIRKGVGSMKNRLWSDF